jgi:hypothetical protein
MRIGSAHYAHIHDAINALDRDKIAAHKEALRGDGRVKDLEMRFRWDLLWASGLSPWMSAVLYPTGVNDDHIDTALRKVVRELGL